MGIGVDQVEIRRMRALLARFPERAPSRLFTPGERAWCDGRPGRHECYAARFAAKEAFLKALGTGWSGGIGWRDVEVERETGGAPRLRVSGAAARRLEQSGGGRVHLSYTHEGGYATATVLIEG